MLLKKTQTQSILKAVVAFVIEKPTKNYEIQNVGSIKMEV